MDHSTLDESLRDAAEALREAESVAVLTGAGVSAESGIDTFRDAKTGTWSKFDAAQLASPEGFAADPETVTRWYDERRTQSLACEPNPGHVALAHIERTMVGAGRAFHLATQNIDGLHRRAGSERMVELHGNIHLWRCTETGEEVTPPPEPFETLPPPSPAGGLLRPCVVWFGETLPEAALEAAWRAAESCDYFMSVGTSAIVYPAAGLMEIAASAGARVLEVNPDPTPLTPIATWSIRAISGAALPRLAALAGMNE